MVQVVQRVHNRLQCMQGRHACALCSSHTRSNGRALAASKSHPRRNRGLFAVSTDGILMTFCSLDHFHPPIPTILDPLDLHVMIVLLRTNSIHRYSRQSQICRSISATSLLNPSSRHSQYGQISNRIKGSILFDRKHLRHGNLKRTLGCLHQDIVC